MTTYFKFIIFRETFCNITIKKNVWFFLNISSKKEISHFLFLQSVIGLKSQFGFVKFILTFQAWRTNFRNYFITLSLVFVSVFNSWLSWRNSKRITEIKTESLREKMLIWRKPTRDLKAGIKCCWMKLMLW